MSQEKIQEKKQEIICEKCNSTEFDKRTVDLSMDNVVKIYKCKKCNQEKSELIHIG